MLRSFLLITAALVAVLIAAAYGVLRYTIGVPGESHSGPLPPLTDEERALAPRLKTHIERIATREHNIAYYAELEIAALYIQAALESYGYAVNRQDFVADGKTVRNIDVVIEPRGGTPTPEVVVVGAHYDSAPNAPGAN